MANRCEKCGNKIGVFSSSLNLTENKVLCYDCAKPILFKIDDLKVAQTDAEFDLLKKDILEKSKKIYSDTIIIDLTKKIEDIYSRTSLKDKAITQKLIQNYMLTTGYDFYGYNIKKYLGVISGQVVLGTGFLSEINASVADFFGEASTKFANKLEAAKNAALEQLILKSADKGGNAIIGVDFDYIIFNNNMIGVVANGTSVIIKRIKNSN